MSFNHQNYKRHKNFNYNPVQAINVPLKLIMIHYLMVDFNWNEGYQIAIHKLSTKVLLIFKRLVLNLACGPLLRLENKAKLKPINWLTQNTISSANFTKHWALIQIKEFASTWRISHPPFGPYAIHIKPSFFERIRPKS